jgi:hypothetical protein
MKLGGLYNRVSAFRNIETQKYMKYSLDILDWQGIAPGLRSKKQWNQWASHESALGFAQALEKSPLIPMMSERRMSPPSRAAVEAGLTLLENHQADAAIFTSRHGELEKTFNILQTLSREGEVSPTDFSTSVHNTAAGWLTIISKNALPITSLAAGQDSFQQGMLEAQAMLHTGMQRVLLIDFDGLVPDLYSPPGGEPFYPYAVALLLAKGDSLSCQHQVAGPASEALPQSLQFLRHWLREHNEFAVNADLHQWNWRRRS